MGYWVYILQSLKDESFYIGYTRNLEARVKEHNEGSTRYTKHKRPWELFYQEEFNLKTEAKIIQYLRLYSNQVSHD